MKWWNKYLLAIGLWSIWTSCDSNQSDQEIERQQSLHRLLCNNQRKLSYIADSHAEQLMSIAITKLYYRDLIDSLKTTMNRIRSIQEELDYLQRTIIKKVGGVYSLEEAKVLNNKKLEGKIKNLTHSTAVREAIQNDPLFINIPSKINALKKSILVSLHTAWKKYIAPRYIDSIITAPVYKSIDILLQVLPENWMERTFSPQHVSRALLTIQTIKTELAASEVAVANFVLTEVEKLETLRQYHHYAISIQENKTCLKLGETYQALLSPISYMPFDSSNIKIWINDEPCRIPQKGVARFDYQPNEPGNHSFHIYVEMKNALTGEIHKSRKTIHSYVEKPSL